MRTKPALTGLTAADRDALERLPQEGWFEIHEVSYMVRNRRWRCDRLVRLGWLESDVRTIALQAIPGARTYVTRYRRLHQS